MPPPLIGGALSDAFVWRLSNVCLSHTSGITREQRGLGRLKLAQGLSTSYVTWTPLSRSKGQGHQAALLTAVLAHRVAAAVGTRTCWPWETAATLPSARRRTAQGTHRGGEGRGIPWRPPARLQLVETKQRTSASVRQTSWLLLSAMTAVLSDCWNADGFFYSSLVTTVYTFV